VRPEPCQQFPYASTTLHADCELIDVVDAKKPTAVSDLLAKGQGLLERLRTGAEASNRTLESVRRALPPPLAEQVWGASVEDGVLSVAVATAAFAARIRYLQDDLCAAVARDSGTAIARCSVRVRPRR
jgi:hypothetical protein